MDLRHEMATARQHEMLAEAAAQRQAQRAQALARATRRVERAEHRLNRSMVHAMRLRAELAAGEAH
jgi:transcription elongation GreA/GreB family factor